MTAAPKLEAARRGERHRLKMKKAIGGQTDGFQLSLELETTAAFAAPSTKCRRPCL
jgi:hypothetical protein